MITNIEMQDWEKENIESNIHHTSIERIIDNKRTNEIIEVDDVTRATYLNTWRNTKEGNTVNIIQMKKGNPSRKPEHLVKAFKSIPLYYYTRLAPQQRETPQKRKQTKKPTYRQYKKIEAMGLLTCNPKAEYARKKAKMEV